MSDVFDLSKGDVFDLSKGSGGASKFYAGLGWSEGPYDLDMSIFPCVYDAAGDPRLISPPYFIYYKNLKSPCGGIIHSPDNLDGQDGVGPTGKPTSDDEWAQFDLDKLDSRIQELAFIVTIHEAAARRHDFSMVDSSYIRICEMQADGDAGKELMRYRLDEDGGDNYAVQFGSLVKQANGSWEFQAVGQGFKADLGTIIQQYMPGALVKN